MAVSDAHRAPGAPVSPAASGANRSPSGPGPSSSSSSSACRWPPWASPFIAGTMFAGVVLAVTFVGVVIIASSRPGRPGDRVAPSRSGPQPACRSTSRTPSHSVARPGLFGWLQSALRDRTGWRAIAYSVLKVPLSIFGVWFAFSVWVDAFFCLGYPLWGAGAARPAEFGIMRNVLGPGYLSVGTTGFFHGLFIFITGVLLVFVAPWTMRGVVFVDRRLMRVLLGPDAMTARLRSLEAARTQTVDASAATLRRIERDLHDGTQAQLVALAMRLGLAKEKLAERPEPRPRPGAPARRRRPQGSQRGHRRAARPGPGDPSARSRYRSGGRAVHPGRPQHGAERTQGRALRPSLPGHRGHRLLLRGRTPRQCGPARPRVTSQHQLRPAWWVAARRCARRRPGRGPALAARFVLQRADRFDGTSPRRRWSTRHHQPARMVRPS